MRVVIEDLVHQHILDFYDAAMKHHETLSYESVMKKIDRLYSSLNSLGEMPTIYANS